MVSSSGVLQGLGGRLGRVGVWVRGLAHPHRPRAQAARVATLAASLLIASCGGGGGGGTGGAGGGGGGGSGGTTTLPPASTLEGRCVAPRAPTVLNESGQPYGDRAGTLADEKNWVRAWIDETYLWYRDVRGLAASVLDPAGYASAVDYFAVLKSPALTPSGRARDRFHFTYDTPAWVALSQSGISFGYGFEVALLSRSVPREAVIAYTDPGTPASAAGIARGARILAVDGTDLVNDGSPEGVARLNAGLFPTEPGTHVLTVRDLGAGTTRNVTLTAQSLASTPVQNVGVLPAPHQNVGYLLFNDHVATAEQLLVDAIQHLQSAGVTELVLDLRYNGGGYLDIASELAYMIAGPARTGGRVFERLGFNDRNPFGLSTDQRTTLFHSTGQGFSVPRGQPLPTLGLGRVSVLAGPGTCSASEAIVNSLRGVGVQVDLIGDTTCGKPYGFYPQDNCGTTFFAIQFQGVNDQGFGDYADGFAPTCVVADDFSQPLGDPREGRLAAALSYRATGVCPAAIARAQPQALATGRGGATLDPPPLRENRFYRGR